MGLVDDQTSPCSKDEEDLIFAVLGVGSAEEVVCGMR